MRHGDPDLDAASLPELLDRVTQLGSGRLPADRLDEVAQLRARAEQRLARGDGLTVVAVVGGTGVGKSALVNRLFEVEVVPTGVRRPTTDHPVAVRRAADEPTSRLLDWLDITDRREVDAGRSESLIVVDLPDHDSVAAEHRTTAARLVGRVDAVVVVVDPLKYARADLHEGPLAALVAHASLVTVALNRIDELDAADVDRCLADLSARLARTGHEDVEVVPTSAVTGDGVDELRTRLTALAATRTAARRRLDADAARLASDLDAQLPTALQVDTRPLGRSRRPGAETSADGATPGTVAPPTEVTDPAEVTEPLLELTGGDRRCAAAELAYRAEAHRATRSYGSRIVRRVAAVGRRATRRSDTTTTPRRGPGDPVTPPPATAVAPALTTLLGSRTGLDRTTATTHARLASLVDEQSARLAPQLVGAVDAHDPRPEQRVWWSAMSLANTLTEAAALAGLVWLVLLRVGDWLALPEPPALWVTERLSLPAALLLGGALLRLVGGGLTRWLRRLGARRHRARLRGRIVAVQREALDRLDAALREEQRRDVELRRVLSHLRGAGGPRGSVALP